MNRLFLIILMMMFSSNDKAFAQSTLEWQHQQISITTAHNARQLGGYKIGDKQIKKDLLLRSARLSSLSAEDSALLADKFRLQCIYDFRGQDEIVSQPDVIPGTAKHLSLSISFAAKEAASVSFGSEAEMLKMLLENAEHPMLQSLCENLYDVIFFDASSQEVYRKFFAELLMHDPEKGAVLWHCTQGKDRAGCASAMLLAALGADRQLIMEDFMLSKQYYDKRTAYIKTETEAQRQVINTLISANPEIFAKTLDKVEARYGSLRNYLMECIAVTPDMMDTLRDRYLEEQTK